MESRYNKKINLWSFEALKGYLISKKSKKWVCLTDDEYGRCLEDYQEYLLGEIREKSNLIDSHNSKLEKYQI